MKILNPSPDDKKILQTVFEKGVKMGKHMERMHGHWKYVGETPYYPMICSKCGSWVLLTIDGSDYCPACGARNRQTKETQEGWKVESIGTEHRQPEH